MKTEVGMYIRTNHRNEKVIRKIVNIYEDSKEHDHQLVFDKPTKYQYFIEDENYISSYRLMDLIKKGDVLHSKSDDEYWTVQDYLSIQGQCICTEWNVIETEEDLLEEIDEIITKEQMKNISYKINNKKLEWSDFKWMKIRKH